MKNFDAKIHRSIDQELINAGYELVDLVPVPQTSNKALSVKTLEGLIKDFDDVNEGTQFQTFVLQVRKKHSDEKMFEASSKKRKKMDPDPSTINDGIYLSNGKLNAQYLLDNALILIQANETSQAKKIVLSLIKNKERMGESLFLLARCLQQEGQNEDALKKYEESILFQPRLETFQHYSSLLLMMNRTQTAADVLERTLLSKELTLTNRVELLIKSSEVWLKCGEPVKSEKNIKKALELQPENITALSRCGEISIEKNNGEEARNYFNLILRKIPSDSNAIFGLARATLLLGDKERALELFTQSLKGNIHNAKAVFHLVKIAYELKQYAEPYEVLKNYIDHTPFNANLLYSLAGFEYHLKHYSDALKTLNTILEMKPDHTEAKNLKLIIEKKLT